MLKLKVDADRKIEDKQRVGFEKEVLAVLKHRYVAGLGSVLGESKSTFGLAGSGKSNYSRIALTSFAMQTSNSNEFFLPFHRYIAVLDLFETK